jgi:hypothetical protein
MPIKAKCHLEDMGPEKYRKAIGAPVGWCARGYCG